MRYNKFKDISSLRAKVYQPTASHTCPHTEPKDNPASIGMSFDQQGEFPATIRFLDQVYCWKSVAAQFFQETGLAEIP